MTIRNHISRTVARQSLRIRKNSPHIMFGVGIAGVVTSTVLACRATLKIEPILDDMRVEVEGAKKNQLETRDLAYIYGKGVGRLGRQYAGSIVVGAVGVGLLTGSHVQLTRRNAALTAAYTTLHQAYLEYRARVREEVGEEKEKDLYFGATVDKIKDENGKAIEVKTVDPNALSPYARFFDEGSPEWHKNAEFNRIFIKCQQDYANNMLQARGFLFLNEVYDALGIPHSSAGQVVGWFINGGGDNYVDFGMYEARNADFINGGEPRILLDFNVDGVILDKI